ncbi:VMAP-C domain-containing protein [Streptomyces sp. YJ-C3]
MPAPDREPLWHLAEQATVGMGPPPAAADHGGRDLLAPPRDLWGSGFFVAPGWVLTCAHVLVDGTGRPRPGAAAGQPDVGVYVDGRVLPGRLAYCMPLPRRSVPRNGGAGDRETFASAVEGIEPDLALIALLEPMERERCVWLTDRPPGEFARDDGGGVIGRFAPRSRDGGHCVVERLTCGHGSTKGTRIKFGLSVDMRPGTSGGPLVDLERGEVVGVIKARFRDGGSGLAVAVSALRELSPDAHLDGAPDLGPEPYHELMRRHDSWHWRRQHPEHSDGEPTWIDVQRELPRRRGTWDVLDRLDALHRLAGVPGPTAPAVVRQLARDALGRSLGHPVGPVSWRDGHGMLHGFGGRDDLAVHLRYLSLVAGWITAHAAGAEAAAAARDLYESVMQRGQALGAKERAGLGSLRPRPRAVLLEFDHAPPPAYLDEGEVETRRYTWTLFKGYDDGRWELAVPPPAEGRPFERARAEALDALAEVLAAADAARPVEDPVPLEVALPGVEFAATVAEWEIREDPRPSSPRSPMGIDRPVVLRDIERRGEVLDRDSAAALAERWQERWRGLVGAPRLVPLRSAAAPAPLRRPDLLRAPHGSVPVLCQQVGEGPGHDAVQRAVGLGYPVALWRADGHRISDGCGTRCTAFHDGVEGLLDREGDAVRTLPGRLWRLRSEQTDEWVRGVVLFYDSPDHPLPQAAGRPLEPPGSRPGRKQS